MIETDILFYNLTWHLVLFFYFGDDLQLSKSFTFLNLVILYCITIWEIFNFSSGNVDTYDTTLENVPNSMFECTYWER